MTDWWLLTGNYGSEQWQYKKRNKCEIISDLCDSIFCQLTEEEFAFFHAQQDVAQSPGLGGGGPGAVPAKPGTCRHSHSVTSLYFPRLLQYPAAAPAAYIQNPQCTSASPSLTHHPKCLLILGPLTASSSQHCRHCLSPTINCLNA